MKSHTNDSDIIECDLSSNYRCGPAWENHSLQIFARWFDTVKKIFFNPSEFYSTMNLNKGLTDPLLFAMIGTFIASIAGFSYQVLLRHSFLAGLNILEMNKEAFIGETSSLLSTIFGGFCSLLLAPVIGAIMVIICSGITHLLLILFGGANRNYEASLRVVAYTSGATSLINIVPMCGGIIAIIWFLILQVVGISKVHEINTSKSAAAVLLPSALCCTCFSVILLFSSAAVISGMFLSR